MESEVAKAVVQPWLVFAVISAALAIALAVALAVISFKNKHLQKAMLQRDRAIRACKKAQTKLESAGMKDDDLAKDIDEMVNEATGTDNSIDATVLGGGGTGGGG